MSGVYLIVWNNEDKDKSKLLKPTKGGYPHVTLAYTGDQLSREQLCNIATKVLADASLHPISLTHAYVNSFTTNTGEERHDVLLGLGVYDTTVISNLRKVYIENSSSYSMHRPHVERTRVQCMSILLKWIKASNSQLKSQARY